MSGLRRGLARTAPHFSTYSGKTKMSIGQGQMICEYNNIQTHMDE